MASVKNCSRILFPFLCGIQWPDPSAHSIKIQVFGRVSENWRCVPPAPANTACSGCRKLGRYSVPRSAGDTISRVFGHSVGSADFHKSFTARCLLTLPRVHDKMISAPERRHDGIGRHTRLKISSRKACGFESRCRHQNPVPASGGDAFFCCFQSSRRGWLTPVLSQHRAYRSVHGAFNS